MMFSFSMPELVLILVIALVVFGPGKLPEVGKAIGKGIQEFRRASTEVMNTKEEPVKVEAKAETDITPPAEKK